MISLNIEEKKTTKKKKTRESEIYQRRNAVLRFAEDWLPDMSMVSSILEDQDKIYSILLGEMAKLHSYPFLRRGTNCQHLTIRYAVG